MVAKSKARTPKLTRAGLPVVDQATAPVLERDPATFDDADRTLVDQLWGKRYGHNLATVEEQSDFIETWSQKYVEPLFADLVGVPQLIHHDSTAPFGLTYERKGSLLLLAKRFWAGLCIFEHSQGWIVVGDDGRRWWLADYLVCIEAKAGLRQLPEGPYSISFLNGNSFDCRYSNIAITPKNGRSMLCRGCGQPTLPQHSRVLRYGGQKLRLCYSCLARET